MSQNKRELFISQCSMCTLFCRTSQFVQICKFYLKPFTNSSRNQRTFNWQQQVTLCDNVPMVETTHVVYVYQAAVAIGNAINTEHAEGSLIYIRTCMSDIHVHFVQAKTTRIPKSCLVSKVKLARF